jgi:hypothetical protein
MSGSAGEAGRTGYRPILPAIAQAAVTFSEPSRVPTTR